MLKASRDPFVMQLQAYLDKHKVRDALDLVRSQDARERLSTDSELMWDTIPVVCSRLRTLNEFRFKTFGVCQDILLDIALICKPKEVLISLLAELENENNGLVDDINGNRSSAISASELKYQVDDSCFKAILKPLQHILIKLPNKRNDTLKWVMSTLNNHILKIPLPREHELEPGNERLLLEGDPTIRRIHLVLPIYLDFLEAFVGECKAKKSRQESDVPKEKIPQRNIMLKALVSLLYHPFMYLDLTAKKDTTKLAESLNFLGEANEPFTSIGSTAGQHEQVVVSRQASSDSTITNNRTINNICPVLRNPLMLTKVNPQPLEFDDSVLSATRTLELISVLEPNLYRIYAEFDFSHKELFDDDTESSLNLKLDEATHALGVLAYLVIGQEITPKKFFVPSVFSHMYILEQHMPFMYVLLERREVMAHEKGLILAEKLITRLDNKSLSSAYNDVLKKYPIEKSLISIMRLCNIKANRQRALKIFKSFVYKFTAEGRYQLIYRTLAEPNQHTGVRGLALSLYKDLIAGESNCPTYSGLFLHRFVRKAIYTCLPEGTETDLVENNDSIMGTLNLVRFLCLRDPKDVNRTKVWDIVDYVQGQLISPLRQAIDVSRAHFKMELSKIEQEAKLLKKPKKAKKKLDIKILNELSGDKNMLDIPDDHELQVIRLSLVKFDMMESVLVRVTELFC
ncbi:Glomulin [Halotydeus destructor]|nr:Glomulin [Halotydeus destructor]